MSKNGKAMVADAQFTNEQQHGVSKPQIYTPGSRRTTRSTTSSSTTATRSTRAPTRHVRAPKVNLQQTKSKKKRTKKITSVTNMSTTGGIQLQSHASSKTTTYHLTNMSTTGGIQLYRQSRFVHGGRLYAVRI